MLNLYSSIENKNINTIYSEIISQLARKNNNTSSDHSYQYSPYISIDLVLKLSKMSEFMLNNGVLQRFQTQIDKINEKIENWLRKQSIFISIYKDVITNYSGNKSLAEWNQKSITSEKEISNKKYIIN